MEATTVSIQESSSLRPNRTSIGVDSSAAPSMCGSRGRGIDPAAFVQDSVSRSAGVIRGLHVRIGAGENKLVRCSAGWRHLRRCR